MTPSQGISRLQNKKDNQDEASVDEDPLDKNLMSVASSLLFCYS